MNIFDYDDDFLSLVDLRVGGGGMMESILFASVSMRIFFLLLPLYSLFLNFFYLQLHIFSRIHFRMFTFYTCRKMCLPCDTESNVFSYVQNTEGKISII